MSLAGARVLARWCPAGRWRESGLRLLCGTGEGACRYCSDVGFPGGWGERERTERLKPEVLSTGAARAGGPARKSVEVPVMGVERRGRLI